MPTENEELLIASVVAAVRGKIPIATYKQFAEFLGCYQYIKPNDRDISFEMLAYLCEGIQSMTDKGMRASSVFQAWLVGDLVESCLTEKQQDKCVRLIRKLEQELLT